MPYRSFVLPRATKRYETKLTNTEDENAKNTLICTVECRKNRDPLDAYQAKQQKITHILRGDEKLVTVCLRVTSISMSLE